LLTSDSGTKTEDELLRRNADLHSDILIKGQHHSGASGSEACTPALDHRYFARFSRGRTAQR
jgi:beta-lactamase superfamily II metal-dependent hydrolase